MQLTQHLIQISISNYHPRTNASYRGIFKLYHKALYQVHFKKAYVYMTHKCLYSCILYRLKHTRIHENTHAYIMYVGLGTCMHFSSIYEYTSKLCMRRPACMHKLTYDTLNAENVIARSCWKPLYSVITAHTGLTGTIVKGMQFQGFWYPNRCW